MGEQLNRDQERARDLRRIKLAATALLVFTAALFIVARHFEPRHWAWGYVAAFAAAATVGGLADWYAVVALFRRPLGLPIPHTAIIPRNHLRIADTLGEFIETNFLAPEPVEARLREVDFAALVADWLSDRERSAALAGFVLRLLPQSLGAIEQSGLKDFIGKRIMTELERVELAPLAAGLLSAVTEKGRHQRLLDELLAALEKVLTNEETLAALREKIRKELPALFNLYRADAYLLRKIVASTSAFIQDARADPNHPLRREFDGFVTGFIERLRSSRGVRPPRREPEARPAGAAGDRGRCRGRLGQPAKLPRAGCARLRQPGAPPARSHAGRGRRPARARSGDPRRDQPRHGAGPGRLRGEPEERRRPLHRRSGEVLGHRHADRPHRAHGRARPAIHPLQWCHDRRAGRFGLARAGAGVEAHHL